MIIAIPLTGNDEFSSHFGGAAKVGLYEVDAATRSIVHVSAVVPPEPEPCGWGAWLATQGVTVVLAGGMGGGARQRMTAAGIEVVVGLSMAEPAALVQAWLAGALVTGVNACEGGHHGHGHEHVDHGHHHHHGEHGHQPGHDCTCGAH